MYRFPFLLVVAIAALLLISSCGESARDRAARDIETALNNWFELQIERGEFVTEENCNPHFFSEPDTLSGFAYEALGIPLSDEDIEMYQIDLGNDTIPDALILFHPVQCDGGAAARWIQYQLLAVSQDSGYVIYDSFFKQFETEKGFIHFSRGEDKFIYGNYFEFYDDDPFCCPSVKRPLKLDLRTNSMEIMR